MLAVMPEPPHDDAGRRPSPRESWAALARGVGEGEAARRCVAMLTADSPADVADTLLRLGDTAPQALRPDSPWKPYWVRVWGARGLLYVWDESCASPVVQGLRDEHWRVAEMCLKVSAKRELGEAAPGAVALSGHELPRVRAAVARDLGIIGDTEHEAVVRRLLADPDRTVRVAAETALARMTERLDLPAGDIGP
jgi:HEAT repeat protein